jgi:hypothetical protein
MLANISKCQQMSENVSIHVDLYLKTLSCQQLVSANVRNCQQMSADVSKCQQIFLSASVSKMMMTPAYPIKHQPDIELTWFSPPASAYFPFSHDLACIAGPSRVGMVWFFT